MGRELCIECDGLGRHFDFDFGDTECEACEGRGMVEIEEEEGQDV